MSAKLKFVVVVSLCALNLHILAIESVVPASTNSTVLSSERTQSSVAPVAQFRFSQGVEDIVRMLKADVSQDVVRAYVENSPVPYALSAAEVIELKNQGVSPQLITALLNRGGQLRTKMAVNSAAVSAGNLSTAVPPLVTAAPSASTVYPQTPPTVQVVYPENYVSYPSAPYYGYNYWWYNHWYPSYSYWYWPTSYGWYYRNYCYPNYYWGNRHSGWAGHGLGRNGYWGSPHVGRNPVGSVRAEITRPTFVANRPVASPRMGGGMRGPVGGGRSFGGGRR